MRKIKYSVVIPHREDFARLCRLLDSIPLSRMDLECLVVDDSSDNQGHLLELMPRYPGVVWGSTISPSGAGSARNVGLAMANGQFVIFADSDDEFISGAFDIFDRSIESKDELVYFLLEGVCEGDSHGSARASRLNDLCLNYYANPTPRNLGLLQIGHVNPFGKVYSKSFIDKQGLSFEETMVSNDVVFNVLGAIRASQIRVVPAPVYRVFRRSGSLTVTRDSEAYIERVRVWVRMAELMHIEGVRVRRSGLGFVVRAMSYGPKVALRVVGLVWHSGLSWSPWGIKGGSLIWWVKDGLEKRRARVGKSGGSGEA